MHFGASLMTVDWVAQFAARLRAELGWTPRLVDLGGGLGVRHVRRRAVVQHRGVRRRARRASCAAPGSCSSCPEPQLALEPGRSLVSRAGITLYTVGGVKRASAATTYVTVDGGMSDNPRPAMYNARYAALLASRADAEPDGAFAIAGKHCESGDVLIERVELPRPQPRRHPRRAGHRRVHARDVVDLQRGAAARGGARRERRGAVDPPARDGRRPARPRELVADLPEPVRGAREEEAVPVPVRAREPGHARRAREPVRAPRVAVREHDEGRRVAADVVQDATGADRLRLAASSRARTRASRGRSAPGSPSCSRARVRRLRDVAEEVPVRRRLDRHVEAGDVPRRRLHAGKRRRSCAQRRRRASTSAHAAKMRFTGTNRMDIAARVRADRSRAAPGRRPHAGREVGSPAGSSAAR